MPTVTLAEDLYLLASDAATGRFLVDTAHLDAGLGGALLLDLALRRHVDLVDGHVVVVPGPPPGHPLLDAALAAIADEPRRSGPDHWVRHLGRGAHRTVQDHLVDAGVLRRDDRRLLRVIPVHRTHESDGRLHRHLRERLEEAVVLDREPSREVAALAALALAIGLERHLFSRSDQHEVRRRLTEIADGGWVAPAVSGEVTVLDFGQGHLPGLEPLP